MGKKKVRKTEAEIEQRQCMERLFERARVVSHDLSTGKTKTYNILLSS
jgi:hypothetical protein